MIVHVQTLVQTTFGLVDDDGNIVKTKAVSAAVNKLDEASFVATLNSIVAAKAQVAQELVNDS